MNGARQPEFRLRRLEPTRRSERPKIHSSRGCLMTFSAAGRRLTKSPKDRFMRRDWFALVLFSLLAVAIRLLVMTLLPSVLHPGEIMWLDQANRLVNHQGLLTWDFQGG